MATLSALAKYRRANGLTFKELGLHIGKSASTAFKYESGAVRIPSERLLIIEKMTGIPRNKLRPDLFGSLK